MRLRRFLKNSVKPGLLFSLSSCLILSGCANPSEPTYKEKDIPYLVKKICKEEYNLEVSTKRTPTTLWIYAPVNKILHADYGIKADKIFDEEMVNKLRNILTTVGRVLISSDNTPEFFALLASDIKLGLDYTLIGCVLDIKKSYAGFIPETEANRRYVIRFKISPEAINDTTGVHLKAYDIKLPDFLAEQISQRIGGHFQGEDRKKYFQVEKSEGKFSDGIFTFAYAINQIAQPDKKIDIKKEALDIITYCLKTYEFKEFLMLEVTDLNTADKLVLSRAAIWERPTE